ncbi:hypothetical protein [Arthrobacter glacialis]|uniref:Uncharacterized protein n=1 Tax=Arthrobacter glacialis TaxID=1664 RepID=A0A2S4A0W5_ARTGL|nr:hypothetical protein [Arthrobacter glacialis]POH75155.1 hypothetical protein CVS27_00650 [Arthrobacter glacialis]
MTEQQTPSAPATTGPGVATVSTAVAGPLTIRDLAVLGSVALIFIASLVPIIVTIAGTFNLWNAAGLFYIGVGVILPLAVGALFLVRRLSPAVKIRIGSLSIDQFASVVACFATFFFFTGTVTTFGIAYLLGLVGSLVLLTATVCAQWIPMLASDFAGRPEVPAHVAARDAVPAVARASAAKTVVATHDVAASRSNSGAAAGVVAGVAAAGAHTTSQPHAWNAPQAAAGHTAAGQIFTPAKETPAAGVGAAGATAGAAAQTVADAAPAATAAAQSATIAAAGSTAPAAQSTVHTTAHTTAQPTTAQPAAQAAAATSAHSAAQASSQSAAANTVADQSADAPATTLNPQVAEPAAVSSAPAPVATPVKESIAATVNPKASAAPVVSDPFWFAVDRPQNVIDEKTRQFVFKLTPGSWILALEDRGSSFLVQDSHGKTGILLDLVGIERASDSQ